jgi:hypothetical protein
MYRQVDYKLWTDQKFLSLGNDGRMLWLFLLTTRFAVNIIPGVIIAGEGAIAEDLDWKPARLRAAFADLANKGMSIRREGRLIWLANAFRYQSIPGPKSVIGIGKIWGDVPDGELKLEILAELADACESWSRVFGEVFAKHLHLIPAKGIGKGIPNPMGQVRPTGSIQEQEQEQEQEQKIGRRASRSPSLSALKAKVDKAASPHHAAIAAFDAYYQRTLGARPTWNGKTAALMAGLVKQHGGDEVIRRIALLEASPPSWPPSPWDMPTFSQHFDKVAAALVRSTSGRVEPKAPNEYPEGEITL